MSLELPPGKVYFFFFFSFSTVGNSQLHSTPTDYLSFTGIKVINSVVFVEWSLANQTLTAGLVGGTMGLIGTIGATAFLAHHNRKVQREAQQHADSKNYEMQRSINEKFSDVKETNLNTQRLILACAAGTLGGLQDDTSEIETFVKGFELFGQAMGCAKVSERLSK